MAELWLVDLEAAAPALEALERATPRLAADDRQRIGRIGDQRERSYRLAAYIALRIALERVAGRQVRGVKFSRALGGKPHLPGVPVTFSLSHADGAALIAVATAGMIGVDVEKARAIRVSERRREEIVAAGAGLTAAPLAGSTSDSAFLQAWTRLEAYAKAHGHGLARVLRDLGLRSVSGRQLARPHIEAAARRLAHASDLEVHDLKLPAGLYGAVAAARGTGAAIRLRRFPADAAAIRRIAARRRPAVARARA